LAGEADQCSTGPFIHASAQDRGGAAAKETPDDAVSRHPCPKLIERDGRPTATFNSPIRIESRPGAKAGDKVTQEVHFNCQSREKSHLLIELLWQNTPKNVRLVFDAPNTAVKKLE